MASIGSMIDAQVLGPSIKALGKELGALIKDQTDATSKSLSLFPLFLTRI